jgi:hypothetical protein
MRTELPSDHGDLTRSGVGKIRHRAPLLRVTVPPKFYGGTERVVAYLTEALIDLGHDVTLFASSPSTMARCAKLSRTA